MGEAVNVNDSWVIENTTVVTVEGGLVELKITLPSGRDLIGEAIKRDQVNKVMLNWCNAVRSNILADSGEAEEARAARLRRNADGGLGVQAGEKPREEVSTSPVEWVTLGYDQSRERLQLARIEYEKTSKEWQEWKVLFEALNLTEGEVNECSEDSKDEGDEASSVGDTVSDSDDLRSGGTDDD